MREAPFVFGISVVSGNTHELDTLFLCCLSRMPYQLVLFVLVNKPDVLRRCSHETWELTVSANSIFNCYRIQKYICYNLADS